MRARQAFFMLSALMLVGLCTAQLCQGQSLGDAARQARQQKQKNGTTAKKVYDLAPTPDPSSGGDPSASSKDDPVPYSSADADRLTPEEWYKIIKAQKDWIAHLHELEEKLKEPPQFDPKIETPESKRQWEERAEQERLVKQIPAQKKKLLLMQADARQARMPQWIVDPH